MKKLKFKIHIETGPERVWSCLWESENYKKWTSVFTEGSHYKTESFTQGNKIHLLTAQGHGMYSILEQLEENKLLVFKHLGELKNFEEQPIEQTQSWTGFLESYELVPIKNGTQLNVTVETADEYIALMNRLFPEALKKVKKMAENESF